MGLPLQTSPAVLNRLGNLLLQMPAGRIQWLDYSLPHTVYNADQDLERVHLIIDVVAKGNDAFERNFLQHLSREKRKQLLAVALPSARERDMDDDGMLVARSMASEMVKRFG